MQDDEIVEMLAKAAHDASPYRPTWEAALDYERDIFRKEQRAALAALRAHNVELIQWTDGASTVKTRLEQARHFQSVIGVPVLVSTGDHVAILRGPTGDTHGK